MSKPIGVEEALAQMEVHKKICKEVDKRIEPELKDDWVRNQQLYDIVRKEIDC